MKIKEIKEMSVLTETPLIPMRGGKILRWIRDDGRVNRGVAAELLKNKNFDLIETVNDHIIFVETKKTDIPLEYPESGISDQYLLLDTRLVFTLYGVEFSDKSDIMLGGNITVQDSIAVNYSNCVRSEVKGFPEYVYFKYLFLRHDCCVSSNYQSEDGKNLYLNKLTKTAFSKNLNVYYYNTETDDHKLYKFVNHMDVLDNESIIWGYIPDYEYLHRLLVITNRDLMTNITDINEIG